jgi:DNA helicase HerA-like ATPase
MFNPVTYLKDYFRGLRNLNVKADEYYEKKQQIEDLSRMVAPDRLEVLDTHLLIDERTYVRCIVGGMTDEDLDGIPAGMTSRAIERIMELSFEGCKVDICTGLIKIPRAVTSKDLKEAYISNSIDQQTAKKNTQGSIGDIQLENEATDIRATFNEIYYNSQNVYNVSFIITIMGGEKEVFQAESYIVGILQSELIEYKIPYDMMLQAFVASRPYPAMDEHFFIRVHSETAAILCTSTSLNSRIDDKGLYFGKDKKTGAEVLIDLASLASQHMVVFGPTRSGKTFTVSLLLMRAHDMLNKRIVYITPKADSRTDYRAVAEYYGEEATIIDIGEFGQSINPLQIMFDPQTMGTSPQAYSSAYFRHIRTLKNFFATWMADEFSSAAKGYLEDTLHKLYKHKGIIRTKPETWKNEFPVLADLRELFRQDMESDRNTSETKKSAGALYRKTSPIGEDGSLNYLNRRDTFIDFSKDYIVIDISGVDEEIKPAMNVLVTGIVGSRFKTDLDKETIIAVDEARVFFRSAHLSNFLLDTVAMGGAQGITLWLMTQNPGDLVKNNVDEEFKTNMSMGIVMGATLDPSKVGPIRDYFHLSQTAVDHLLQCEQGEGLLLISGRREEIPIKFEPTDQEEDIIKGRYQKKRPSPIIGSEHYYVTSKYEHLVAHHGVILKDWIEGDDSYLTSEGWVKTIRLPTVTGRGTCTMWHRKGAVQGNQMSMEGLGKMTVEHFVCVVQIESYLVSKGIKCSSDHNQGADIKFQIGDKLYAIEYEMARSHTEKELVEKKERLFGYDDFRFVCSADDYKTISKAVGEEYTVSRGKMLIEWIDSLSECSSDNQLTGEQMVVEPIEAL